MQWIRKYWYVVAVVVIPITATTIYFLIQWYKKSKSPAIKDESITDATQIPDTPDTTQDNSMNDIIRWMKEKEGGWVDDPSDSGGETNKGITYATWCMAFGTDAHDRFMEMSDDDWFYIFKKYYWDVICGDQIKSVTIANFLVDWYWGSGAYAIGKHFYGVDYGLQPVLNRMGYSLSVDGSIGPKTLAALNEVDVQTLYTNLRDNRFDYYNSLALNIPKDKRFLAGWQNRLADFISKNNT